MWSLVRLIACAALLASPELAHAEEAQPSLRVYMRSDGQPLTFSARAENSAGSPTFCAAPCDARLSAGNYRLKLNGHPVEETVAFHRPGTLRGELRSHEASRSAGWLALNVGGIIGGVFITVAALGGPSWGYVAGGGSIAAAGVLFAVTYRADQASVSFSPDLPSDVRGMPEPHAGTSSGAAGRVVDGARLGTVARGFSVRIDF